MHSGDKSSASARTGLACAILLALSGVGPARGAERQPVLATPHFAFYSDFDTNLNDALIAAGLARHKGEPELFHAGDEAPCFEGLPPSERAAWEGAVGYYAEIISPGSWMARPQYLLRLDLVGFSGDDRDARATELVGIARSFRAAAAPAYRACRWSAQDAQNRGWIEELEPRLAADGERAAARLVELYRKRWQTLPILVDVVETVDWSGANTSWSDEGQGDVLISSTVGGPAAFEILFHEASHVLMDRGDPVRRALDRAAEAAGFDLPRDLWHVVLFYTTGEAVRPILEERGAAGYTPMLYEIFGRGTWVEDRAALESAWRPYVEGKCSLDQAAAGLVAALQRR